MMGLIVIAVFVIYLAISIGVVWWVVRWARRAGRKPWVWGTLAGLAMYLLVFWDHIPTLIAHKYYCDNYAGLKVYKTVEQWKAENPGVAETLRLKKEARRREVTPGITRLDINERFAWDKSERTMALGIKRIENVIEDKLSNTDLVRQIDFSTDIMNISLGARGFRDYKFWLGKESCQKKVDDRREFYKFEASIEKMGGGGK